MAPQTFPSTGKSGEGRFSLRNPTCQERSPQTSSDNLARSRKNMVPQTSPSTGKSGEPSVSRNKILDLFQVDGMCRHGRDSQTLQLQTLPATKWIAGVRSQSLHTTSGPVCQLGGYLQPKKDQAAKTVRPHTKSGQGHSVAPQLPPVRQLSCRAAAHVQYPKGSRVLAEARGSRQCETGPCAR